MRPSFTLAAVVATSAAIVDLAKDGEDPNALAPVKSAAGRSGFASLVGAGVAVPM
jgi:hypothetical protein